jgi:hypothetical protein
MAIAYSRQATGWGYLLLLWLCKRARRFNEQWALSTAQS